MRSMILSSTTIVALSSLLFACEQPGRAEQEKTTQAANQAASAEQQAENNRAAANRDLVNAQEEFAKTRENYLHGKRVDLINLDERVFDLESKVPTATGKARANLLTHLPGIRAQRQEFARNLEAMGTESGVAWDNAKADLDKEWDRLSASVGKAE
jgi:uncharacterized protein YicC (UPF0701 family)